MNLPVFYTEYADGRQDFNVLYSLYTEVQNVLTKYLNQIVNNAIITKVETFRKFPIQRIDVSGIRYRLADLLSDPLIIDLLSLGSIGLVDRVTAWNDGTITIPQKISALDLAGYYVTLYANRGILGEENTYVIDFKLSDSKDQIAYSRNLDYIFQNDRLYLIGDIAVPSRDVYLVMKDIYVDLLTADYLLGERIGLLYNSAMTKNEYSELMSMLIRASLKGPVIKDLQSEIRSISEFSQSSFYDMYSYDTVKSRMWTADGSTLTPFDFIVSFPTSYLNFLDKLNALIQYLNLVKPSFSKMRVLLTAEAETETYDVETETEEVIEPAVMIFMYSELFGSEIASTALLSSDFVTAYVELISTELYNINIDFEIQSRLIRVSDGAVVGTYDY